MGEFRFQDFLLILIVIAIVAGILIYLYLLNKSLNGTKNSAKNMELEERRGSIKVTCVSGFMPYKYRLFFETLKKAMPANYIILPNIAIELLFQRAYRKELQLEGEYLSFCVFNTDFVPILAISLTDFTDVSDTVFRLTESQKKLIQSAGIPVMEYEIRDSYSIDELRRSLAKAMNPLYIGN